MNRLKTALAAGLIYAFAAGSLSAAGRSGGRILEVTTLPGVAALGEAYSARSGRAASVSINPAALARIRFTEAVFAHTVYYADTSLTSVSAAWKWGSAGLGGEWKQFYSRDIYRDEWGGGRESFVNRFTRITLGGGVPVYGRVSCGVSVSTVKETLYEYSDTALSLGAGVYITGFRGDSFAFTVRNFGTSLEHKDRAGSQNTLASAAGAHRMGNYILSWELLRSRELDLGWRAGLEGDLSGLILRGGLRYEHGADFSLGVGVPYGRWNFDYAYSPHRDLEAAHRISVGALF